MTKMTSNIVSTFYSDDLRLMAQVSVENDRLYVDFFKDEVLIGYQMIDDHSVFYAESMAENYTLGVIKVDPETWRINV
ncbi:hypothetical protein UFOVP395_180 [uncultured Caudovirales phage]|jgi:hypothetical protein|uniref:Uncharacterized protein n=1 Tax=uncultured Caudovirales phage TaxID=2100421 RepID=A0A6J5M1N6_9CAUD|nr:hypothetical protein UFOVP395_180 [uncultured Caudovirales phage]